jgi:hypothetical protein
MKDTIFSSTALQSALSLESSAFQQSILPQYGSHRFLALNFALQRLSTDQKPDDLTANSLREFLSNNDVCFREVKVPDNLTRKRPQILLLESNFDESIYVVFRNGVQSYAYNTGTGSIFRIKDSNYLLSQCSQPFLRV